MHSIQISVDDKTWTVIRCEVDRSHDFTKKVVLFNRLSFNTAMRVANSLNGGQYLGNDLLKVLEMCKA